MASPEEIAQKYMSPRATELDALDSYITGKQYEGRVDWFDVQSEVPLFNRKPCINYPIAKSAISSHVSFVLGEGRWPDVSSATSEDDVAIDEEWGLTPDDSDALGRFVNVVLVRYARLKQVAREMLGDAMSARSVAVVISIRRGRVFAETVRAAWCTPELNDIDECERIEIRYPYIEPFYNDDTRRWERRCMIYRRIIDAVSDTVYQPGKGRDDGREPDWFVDKTKTRDHGLGFCPVIWYPFMKPCSAVGTIDGIALHEQQLGEIDCLNIALSQKQRAAVTAGDPQLYEVGVPDGYNPAPAGQASRGMIDAIPGPGGKAAFVFSSNSNARVRTAVRKRGAGAIWTYRDSSAKVGYLTIPGDALKAIDDHARDMRAKIAEALWAIFIDPNEMKMHSALSGKALSYIFARQLAFDDQVRDDFGSRALMPLISMVLRTILVVGRKNPRGLYVPGVAKILPILEKFEREMSDDSGALTGEMTWLPPRLEPVWGPYFAPNEQDQLAVVQLVVAALQGETITREMALDKYSSAGVFEIGSSSEVAEQIEKKKDDDFAKQQEQLHTAMSSMDDHGASAGRGNKPGAPPAGGARNGAAAAAA